MGNTLRRFLGRLTSRLHLAPFRITLSWRDRRVASCIELRSPCSMQASVRLFCWPPLTRRRILPSTLGLGRHWLLRPRPPNWRIGGRGLRLWRRSLLVRRLPTLPRKVTVMERWHVCLSRRVARSTRNVGLVALRSKRERCRNVRMYRPLYPISSGKVCLMRYRDRSLRCAPRTALKRLPLRIPRLITRVLRFVLRPRFLSFRPLIRLPLCLRSPGYVREDPYRWQEGRLP